MSIKRILLEGTINNLPIKKIDKVFHVGDMNIQKKSKSSLEGSGLSVSLHPEEWQKIAHLDSENTFILSKNNGVFVDAYKLNKEQKQSLITWGIEQKYIIQDKTYRIYYYDEELSEHVYMEFSSYDEAQEEVEEGYDIKIKKGGIVATKKLNQKTMQDQIDPSLVYDLLLTVYAEGANKYDGIWWSEKLDVLRFSAPRGVIFNSKLNDWSIDRVLK